MNIGKEMELVTPSLESGVILPGVTRQSVIELAREEDRIEVRVDISITCQQCLQDISIISTRKLLISRNLI